MAGCRRCSARRRRACCSPRRPATRWPSARPAPSRRRAAASTRASASSSRPTQGRLAAAGTPRPRLGGTRRRHPALARHPGRRLPGRRPWPGCAPPAVQTVTAGQPAAPAVDRHRPDRHRRRHDQRRQADRRHHLLEQRLQRPGHRRRPARLGRPAGQRPDDPQQAGHRPGPVPRVAVPNPQGPRHVRPRHAHGGHHRRPRHRHHALDVRDGQHAASSAWRPARGSSASSWPTPRATPTSRRSSRRSTGSSRTPATPA